MGQRWLLDTYAALWLFTANHSFYPGHFDAHPGARRGVPGAPQLQYPAPDVGGLRRDLLRRGARRPSRVSPTLIGCPTCAWGRPSRPAGRTTALGQTRGERGRRCPIWCRLHHVLRRVADGAGRHDPACPVVWWLTQSLCRRAGFAQHCRKRRGGPEGPRAGNRASLWDLLWWTAGGSNSRPPRCERGALPAELAAQYPTILPRAARETTLRATNPAQFSTYVRALRLEPAWP